LRDEFEDAGYRSAIALLLVSERHHCYRRRAAASGRLWSKAARVGNDATVDRRFKKWRHNGPYSSKLRNQIVGALSLP
jgi:hypothetical protein